MNAPLAALSALPAYPGGKRRLLPLVFGLIAEVQPLSSWPQLAFADAFMGAGSVALAAKALGWGSVSANDLAERSALIGRALVANSTQALTQASVLRLFEPIREPGTQLPTVFGRMDPPVAAFLSNAWAHVQSGVFAGIERDLVTFLLTKVLLRSFPMSLPSASDARHVPEQDFDRVSGPRLAHYLSAGRRLVQPAAVLRLAETINSAILPGNGKMSQCDVFEFLATTPADVVYLDPPYGGTQAYERAFALLDEFLGATPLPVSAFSSKSPPLDELLDACRHIPVLVLSLNNALLDEDGLRALVSRHRQVGRLFSIPYRHYGAVASVRKNAANREFLAFATIDGRRTS